MPSLSLPIDPLEDPLGEAVQVYEQEGEPGLAAWLSQHQPVAAAVRAHIDRLLAAGLLRAPVLAAAVGRQYGEFVVQRVLGAGGMGVVYAAEQTSLQRTVALKVVRPEFLASTRTRERFRREIDAIARLYHPGIVPILAVGADDAEPWFAMEYVEGKALDVLLDGVRHLDLSRAAGAVLRTPGAGSPGSSSGTAALYAGAWWEACARIVLQIAHAMQYVHERGIVHRDLKPSNIVLTPQGQARVLDFGIAHVRDLQRMTGEQLPMGSPFWMAPEQVRGEACDERVDVYGLGVTMYELLTGRLPFHAPDPGALREAILAGHARPVRAYNRAVPRDLAIVCAVAMDRDRSRRYRSMAEFAADVEAVLARRPIQARPLGLGLRTVRLAQRHPVVAIAAAASMLLALQFPLVLWHLQAEANRELAEVNAQLVAQRGLADGRYADALAAIEQTLVFAADRDLVTTPGTEDLQLAILQRADVMYERLLARGGADDRLAFYSARNLQQIGKLQSGRGKHVDAERAFRAALQRAGSEGAWQGAYLRGTIWRLYGLSLFSRGLLPEAEAAMGNACCELDEAWRREPYDRGMRRQRAEAIAQMAKVRQQQGRHDEHVQLLREAQAEKDALVAEQPGDLEGALACALGCENLAEALRMSARTEAKAWADRGVSLLVQFLPRGGHSRELRSLLGCLFEEQSGLLEYAGDVAGAEAADGRAFAVRWSLAQDFPATAAHWQFVAASLHNLAFRAGTRGDLREACSLSTEAIATYRRACRQDPANREFAAHLENSLGNHCGYLLRSGNLDELATSLDELAAVATRPDTFLEHARMTLRLGARLRARDGDAAEERHVELRERAMRSVEAAIARGFQDRSHFEQGRFARFYDDLRSWPEFGAAMAKLPAR